MFFFYKKHIVLLSIQLKVGIRIGEGFFFWSFGSNRSNGVGIWFRTGLNVEVISTDRDSEGRILLLLVKVNNAIVRLVNIYATLYSTKYRRHFFF